MLKSKVKGDNHRRLRLSDDDNFRTAHVPSEVLKSVTSLKITETGLRENPVLAAKVLCKHGGISQLNAVRFIEAEALQRIASSRSESARIGIELLVECALYYHAVGHVLHGIRLLTMALSEADRISDINLLRRTHNSLGGIYATQCDFEMSCKHLEKSLNLAKQLSNPVFILASLANTVAALERMGFLENARELALRLITQPEGTEELDYLHLANANNAIRICYALNDQVSADIFYRISSAKANSENPIITDVTRAHFESARATHLIAHGTPDLALPFLNKAIERNATSTSMRSTAVLFCAQAVTHLALKEKEKIGVSKAILRELLTETKESPDLQEDLLGTLIKLHSADKTKEGRRETLRYLRRLREHVVVVKFGHFLFKDAVLESQSELQRRMAVPVYAIPSWILKAGSPTCLVGDDAIDSTGVSYQFEPIEVAIAKVTESKLEPKLRTKEYCIAERWAVAVECTSEGSSSHCFKVGKLAGLIAGQLGWSFRRSLKLELACRIHDIGKLSMVLSRTADSSLRSLGQFGIISTHTILGEQLLAKSSDPVLRLAATVAKSHHEWWNGCGFPSSLREKVVPVEGRICAVADALVTLVDPPVKHAGWSIERAFNQVRCSSGVQFDPEVVTALGRVLEGSSSISRSTSKSVARTSRKRQFLELENNLYDVLEPLN